MRRAIIYSFIFHLLLFSLIFFLKEPKKESREKPFYARIITPEELQKLLSRETLPERRGLVHPFPFKEAPEVPKSRDLSGKNREKNIIKTFPKRLEQQQVISPQPEDRAGEQIPPAVSPLTKQEFPPVESLKKKPESFTGERLFDKDIISKLAEREKNPPTESSLTFSTREFRYQGYMQRLKEKIERIWKYPRDAAERGIYGDLYIRFTILKNGRLGAVELIRTSGYKSLDDAALKALKDGEPYWPLPDEWGKDGLTITGHFIYTYYGGYIR